MALWLPSWLGGDKEANAMSNASSTPFTDYSRRARAVIIPRLTDVQHITAIPLAAFLFVHLAAAAALPIGGSEGATEVMVLGRELYQTSIGEPLLLASLTAHLTAGVLKRLLLLPTSPPTPAHLFAYPLAGFLLLHTASNRLYAPTPGGADFQFVKLGVKEWPVRAGAVYAGVVVLGLGHAFGAGWTAWRRRFGVRRSESRRTIRWGQWVYVGLVAWIGAGMAVLVTERAGAKPAWIMDGYRSAWRSFWFYR